MKLAQMKMVEKAVTGVRNWNDRKRPLAEARTFEARLATSPRPRLGSRYLVSVFIHIHLTMSAILKDEEFVAVEAAVKAGVAPQPVAAAFNEVVPRCARNEKTGRAGELLPQSHELSASSPHLRGGTAQLSRSAVCASRNTALAIATSRAASCSASCACVRST